MFRTASDIDLHIDYTDGKIEDYKRMAKGDQSRLFLLSHVNPKLFRSFIVQCMKRVFPHSARLLEVGAGRGFMSCMLNTQLLDVEVIATDAGSHRYKGWEGVEKLDTLDAIAKYADRGTVLLIVWPNAGTKDNIGWAAKALDAARTSNVDGVIYIGHLQAGECTATPDFYDMLEDSAVWQLKHHTDVDVSWSVHSPAEGRAFVPVRAADSFDKEECRVLPRRCAKKTNDSYFE